MRIHRLAVVPFYTRNDLPDVDALLVMYVVAIAWLYVAMLMALAEATGRSGSVLGGVITFVLYGVLPLAIVMYVLGTPARRARRQHQEASAEQPDGGGHAAGDAVAPEREEP